MFLTWYHKKPQAVTAAMKSEKGEAYHTPSSPQNSGKMRSAGMRNRHCRLKLRNIAFQAIPILWKNWLMEIWEPTTTKTNKLIRRPLAVTSINSGSLVNARAINRGNRTLASQPNPMMIVAVMMTKRKTSCTRLCCPAP